MSENEEKKKDSKIFYLIGLVTLVWIGIGITPAWLYDNGADRGTFGDMFGFVNSLFSGLAFVGLIYTIYLQKEELGLQREEMRQTRLELQRSAQAQENMQREQRRQSENLKATARINGCTTMIEFYSGEIKKYRNTPAGEQYKNAYNKRVYYLEQIERDLLNKMDNENNAS